MIRRFWLFVLFSLIATGAYAQCNLQITVTCPTLLQGQGGVCTATTVNAGPGSCNGEYYTGFFVGAPAATVAIGQAQNSLGLADCFSSGDFDPNGESGFMFCFGTASLPAGGSFTSSVRITPLGASLSTVPVIGFTGVLDPITFDELAFVYAYADATVPSCTPTASVAPISQSGLDYVLSWSQTSSQAPYEIQQSTTRDFSSDVNTFTVQGTSRAFRQDVTRSTTYYYRVRSTNCGGGPGPYSDTVAIVVQAEQPPQSREATTVVPLGSTTPVSVRIFIPGPAGKSASGENTTFTATSDKPYITVSPSSGVLPPGGTTLTATINPSNLPPGANTGTVTVTPNSGLPLAVPVSVSLVTPVSPGKKTLPTGNTLIIPVVTHVNGAAGPFLSDVRLSNLAATAIDYQITFTPTETDATQNGKSTTVRVSPTQTIALNDIAKDFFGFGATGDPADFGFGSLEIRPLNSSSTSTYASSRTYAKTDAGTFGQYVAAMPFTQFATRVTELLPIPGGTPTLTSNILSLQQVAQSSKFRTNLGIVEGSGTPASGRIRVFDALGTLLREVPFSLKPGEHKQMNQFIATQAGIPTLEDGRIEIVVDSDSGAVTAYASVLDQKTTDPLAVMPVQVSTVSARRYVLPGMAEFSSPFSNFHSDVRLFNGGPTEVTVNATHYPRGNGAPVSAAPFQLGANQVKVIDNILPSLFNLSTGGGSVVFTTSNDSSLVATGRTFSIDSNGGTFGQFIPGVMPQEGIGVGDRPLQVLQLEQSARFRTNVGLTEVAGLPATVRIRLTLPDSLVSGTVEKELAPNEFVQYDKIIEQFIGAGKNTYNARISMEVIGGSGRIAAYGSVVDNLTSDPTYVPSQK